MKTIGIIGGMGPAATIDLYSKIVSLTPAEKDQDHIHVIIDGYAQIEDRTAYIEGRGASPLPKLIESARRLENAGADFIIMPCNTAHYFAEEISAAIDVALIHIVETAAESVIKNYPGIKKVALFATSGTKKAGIYAKVFNNRGLHIISLPDETEKDIMECIYSGVKAGKIKEYAPILQECANKAENLGAEAIIAGCTEIPLLAPYINTYKPVVDATMELAKAAVALALK